MQPLQPLTVQHVALAPRHVLDAPGSTSITSNPRSSSTPNSGIQYTPADSMTKVSTPHSDSQSARRYRSAVKAANSCTGCSARSAGTATKWLLASTSTPAASRFTWDSSAGRRSRIRVVWPVVWPAGLPAGFALLWRVVIISSCHVSLGASPEEVADSSHSPERDRPDWDVTNDAAVRLPDHALSRAICASVHSAFVQTTRLAMSLHPGAAKPVSLLCPARNAGLMVLCTKSS